jgi:signal peptidase II
MQAEGGASLNDANHAGRASRRRCLVLAAVVTGLVLAADVVTKLVAMAQLSDRPPVPLLGGLLTLRLVRNSGAAFGLARGYTIILSLLAVGVVVVVLRLSKSLRSIPWAVAFGLLLGGALGNLSDRVFREPGFLRGHVVDFIALPYWPVFNLADTAVCVAAGLIMVMALRGRRWDGTTDADPARPDTPSSPAGEKQRTIQSPKGAPPKADSTRPTIARDLPRVGPE